LEDEKTRGEESRGKKGGVVSRTHTPKIARRLAGKKGKEGGTFTGGRQRFDLGRGGCWSGWTK